MIETKRQAQVKLSNFEIDNSQNNTGIKLSNINQLGVADPVILYNGYHITSDKVYYFQLFSTAWIPSVHLIVQDWTQILKQDGYALDNTVIGVYIKVEEGLNPIKIEFKIIDYDYHEEEDTFEIKGVINVDRLYLEEFLSYNDTTSFRLLDNFSSQLNLGFNTNINSTNDNMNWINPGLENLEWIKDVVRKSYLDDNSFLFSFIDFYYNLNFINVEKELKEPLRENPGIISSSSNRGVGENNTKEIKDMVFTNDNSMPENMNLYISSMEIYNKSTKVSLNNGYTQKTYVYDRSGNWQNKAGTLLKFNIQTNTSELSDDNSIILKGLPGETNQDSFFQKNIKHKNYGILDLDNTHLNYKHCQVINSYNLSELEKVYAIATLPNPNFNLYRYQKIKIIWKNINNLSESGVNPRLSGEWLITGIYYERTPEAPMQQKLVMIKRELSDYQVYTEK